VTRIRAPPRTPPTEEPRNIPGSHQPPFWRYQCRRRATAECWDRHGKGSLFRQGSGDQRAVAGRRGRRMPQLGTGLFERGVRDDGDVVLRGREGSGTHEARRRRAGRGSPPAARVRLRYWLNPDSQAGMGASIIGRLTHRTRGRARARSETEARAADCSRGGRRAVFGRPSRPHP